MTDRLRSGLPNFGNTCYINSILQCLRYQKPLVFMLREHRGDGKDAKGRMLESFVELLYADADKKDLHLFVRYLAQLQPQFRLLRQCDSHELYLYVIDTFFEAFSDLTNPFRGALESTVTCMTCGNDSVTCFPFISLSLEMRTSTAPLSVTEMLSTFQSYETLQDPVDCERCKQRRQSRKKLRVKDAPELIAVHLKRFDGTRKNRSPVVFEKSIVVNGQRYNLSASCNHTGTLSGGHDTATCLRKDMMWVVCNDSHVSKIQDLPRTSKVPYMLFYEKERIN